MKTLAQETPYGYTIFCDDIRMEVGNKPSFIGIYSDSVNVNKIFPATLAKFALAVFYYERPGESTEPVRLSIFFPGDADDAPTINADIPIEQMRSRSPPWDVKGEDPVIGVIMHVIVAPFKIEKEGFIKARAYRGDLEIKLGAIHVSGEPEEKQPDAVAENPT